MSQVQPSSKTIGEHQFTIYMLPPMQSHDLLMDLVQMVGPGLGPVFDALSTKAQGKQLTEILGEDLSSDFFSKAASALFGGLRKEVLERIIRAFRTVTQVDGKTLDPVFDAFFLGRLDMMYSWLVWGMGVQWGKVFGVLLGGLNKQDAGVEAPARSQSPSTSTG